MCSWPLRSPCWSVSLQTGMGLLRLGFLVNFLSHPVLVGFSSAAAIVIGFSQVKNLLGVSPAQS